MPEDQPSLAVRTRLRRTWTIIRCFCLMSSCDQCTQCSWCYTFFAIVVASLLTWLSNLPEHGVDCGIGCSCLVVVLELRDEFLRDTAAIIDQLQRSVCVVKRKATPDQNPEIRCKKRAKKNSQFFFGVINHVFHTTAASNRVMIA